MSLLRLLDLPVEDLAAIGEKLLLRGLLQQGERAGVGLLERRLQGRPVGAHGIHEVQRLRVERR